MERSAQIFNFHNNKILKDDSQYICLSIIMLDSLFRAGKN